MKQIKVLIVGAGRIAGLNELDRLRIKPCTHYGAFNTNKNFKVEAVVDHNFSRAKKFAKLFKIKSFSSVGNALKVVRPDLVTVAVPYSKHFSVIKKCSISNFKPKIIFCEKPLSDNSKNAKEIIKICERKKIQLFVNNRRLDEPYQILKNILIKKFKNKITSVNANCSSGMHTIGSHLLDLLRYICGDVSYIFSIKDNTYIKRLPYSKNFTNKDPRISSILKFKNGIICTFNCSAKLDYTYFEIEVLCKDGKIRVSDNGKLIEYWVKKKPKRSTLSFGLRKKTIRFKNKSLFARISKYIFASRKIKNNLISGKEGYNTYRLIDLMIKSSKNNKKIYA